MRRLPLLLALLVLGASAKADVYSGLVARYKFDGNGNDFYGNYNLTTVGTISYVVGRKGLAARGFTLASRFSASTIPQQSTFTITCFLSLTATTGTNSLLVGQGGTGDIRFQADRKLYFIDAGGGYRGGLTALNVGEGYFLSVEKDTSGVSFYKNGIFEARNTTGNYSGNTNFANFFSLASNTDLMLPAIIDDFRIYNRALSAGEIANIYATSMKSKQPNFMFTYPCFGCF